METIVSGMRGMGLGRCIAGAHMTILMPESWLIAISAIPSTAAPVHKQMDACGLLAYERHPDSTRVRD